MKRWPGAPPTRYRHWLAAVALLICSCDRDPAGPDALAPKGIRVSLNGAVLVTARGGNVGGALHVHVGEYSGQFIIALLDDEGRPVTPPNEYSLQVSTADTMVAAFHATSEGAFEGNIVSRTPGATTIVFSVFRIFGDEDRRLYETPLVDVEAIQCGIFALGSASTPFACAPPRP